MRILWPLALLGLLIVPLAALAYWAIQRRRALYAVYYTNVEVLATVITAAPRWRRYLPAALAALALTCAVAALSRPELEVSVPSEEASIVLTVDVSGSMAAADVKPTRLGAAQIAISRFLERLPKKYRVGLVTFSSEPFVASALTDDRKIINDSLTYNMGLGRGTAIGDALARSVELLQPVATGDDGSGTPGAAQPMDPDRPVAAILLLSDGAQTRGTLTPEQGADRAKSYGIPVYSVALGTPEGVLDMGAFQRAVPPDPTTLQQIAATTGGEFFATQDEAKLSAVYEDLASRLGEKEEWREYSAALLGLAAVLALVAGAFSLLWAQRLP